MAKPAETMRAAAAAEEKISSERQMPFVPKGWVARVYVAPTLTAEAEAHARLLEASGHLDAWNEDPDIYK